jgi:hypothetical protein
LKLKYDELLSNFAFNFNLRRHAKAKQHYGRAVQVDSMKTRVESAYNIGA